MIKLRMIIIANVFVFFEILTSICMAGSANLTLIHENPTLLVNKYIVKYSNNVNTDPASYPDIIEVIPKIKNLEKTIQKIDLGTGTSGYYYFVVKEIYEDGTESEYSDKSLPVLIPQKPKNLTVK